MCMGFSIISGVEIIYFFTIRMLFDYRKEKKEFEAEENENESEKSDTECP